METLLPSEVARLVYGYLVHENCHVAARVFLENSPNLKECHRTLEIGRKFNTNIDGKNLFDLLDLVFLVKNKVMRFADEYEKLKARPPRTVLSLLKLFEIRNSSAMKRKPERAEESTYIKEKVKKNRKSVKGKVSEMISPLIRHSSSSTSLPPGRGSSEEESLLADVTMSQEVESDDSDVMEVFQSATSFVHSYDSGDPHAKSGTPDASFERAVTPPYTPPRPATSEPAIKPSSPSAVASPLSLSTSSLTNVMPLTSQMPRRHILPQQPTRPITNSRRPSFPSASQNNSCSQPIHPKPHHQS